MGEWFAAHPWIPGIEERLSTPSGQAYAIIGGLVIIIGLLVAILATLKQILGALERDNRTYRRWSQLKKAEPQKRQRSATGAAVDWVHAKQT
jgi:hypothetical protein